MDDAKTIVFIVDSETGKHINSVEVQYAHVEDAKTMIKSAWQSAQKKGKHLLTNFTNYLVQLYPITFAFADNSNKDYKAYCTVLVDAQNS